MKNFLNKYKVLLIVVGLHLICNIFWLKTNTVAPAWDQSSHLNSSIVWGQYLSKERDINFIEIIRYSWGYPPLMYFLGGLWSNLVGSGIAFMSFLNSIVLIFVLWGIFKLGEELFNKRVAEFSVIIFSLLPVIVDISRNYLLDLLLVNWVVWGLWAFVKSKYFYKFRYTLLFALFLVLAALTKLNAFIYFIPVALLEIWFIFKNKKWELLINLIIVGLLFVIGVSWWWVLNFTNIMQYLGGLAGQGEPLTDPMNLLKINTWLHYFKLLVLHQISPLITILMFVVLYLSKDKKLEKNNKYLIVVFLGVNYFIFTLIKNKDFRFTMPLLPVLIIYLSSKLDYLFEEKRKYFKVIFALILFFLMFNFINNSFAWPIKKDFKLGVNSYIFGDMDFVNISDYPLKSPKKNIWMHDELVGDVENNSKVLILINLEEINDNNLKLYSLINNKNILWESTGDNNKFRNKDKMLDFLENYNLALVPKDNFEPAPFYVVNLEAIKQLRDYLLFSDDWIIIKEYKSNDGRELYLLKKI